MGRENNIGLLVSPTLDPKAVQSLIDEFTKVQKTLNKSKIEWGAISKQTRTSASNLTEMSRAAKEYSKALTSGVKDAGAAMGKLGDQLNDALVEAEALQEGMQNAKNAKVKDGFASKLKETQLKIAGLNKEVESAQKAYRSHAISIDRVGKSYEKLQGAAKFGMNDLFKNMGDAFKGGGAASIGKSLTAALGRGAASAASRAGGLGENGPGPGGTGAMASAMGAVAKALPALTAAVGLFTMFWQALSAASDHLTKLNKTIIDGTGTANDFVANSDSYRGVINDIQTASVKASGALLKYGANSETAAKMINKFASESSGSLIKTRNSFIDMYGSLDVGVEKFTINSLAYGRALGMEGEEVASMMGKLVSEAGYQAEDVQGIMENIVKTAATVNMPMTKFRDIFKSVIPEVELYKNRMEELTGVMKLLSRTMSAKDVKQFMESFAKGFEGTDFRSRLKTVLMVGTDKVSKALEMDFGAKAKKMAESFAKYGIKPEEFAAAWEKGESGIQGLIATARGRAASQSIPIQSQDISNLLKLTRNEASRRKGDPLSMATAMRGAGLVGTYKILKEQSQRFTKGFDGLSEHVIKQTGITEAQYESMRNMSQTIEQQQTELKMYGKTSSKTMNQALKETVSQRKTVKNGQETLEQAMRTATEDELLVAAEASNKQDSILSAEEISQGLAAEQTTATMSISDKISNVIAFLLEKIYKYALEPILDAIDSIWAWVVGDKSAKSIDQLVKSYDNSEKDKAKVEQFKMIGESMRTSLSEGDIPTAISKAVEASGGDIGWDTDTLTYAFSQASGGDQELAKALMSQFNKTYAWGIKSQGMSEEKAFENALSTTIGTSFGDKDDKEAKANATTAIMMSLAKTGINSGKVMTDAAINADYEKGAGERLNGRVESKRQTQTAEEQKRAKEEAEAADLETDMIPIDGSGGVASLSGVASNFGESLSNIFGSGPGSAPSAAVSASTQIPTESYNKMRDAENITKNAPFVNTTGRGPAPTEREKQKGPKGVAAAYGSTGDAIKKLLMSVSGEGGASGEAGASADPVKVAESTLKTAETTTTNTADTSKKLTDLSGELRSGIIYESSFFNKYFKKMEEVMLKSLRTALLEQVLIELKAGDDANFKEALLDEKKGGANLIGMGTDAMLGMEKDKDGKYKVPGVQGTKAIGGIIPATGKYLMHRGENVTPVHGGGIGIGNRGGGGSGIGVVNVVINGTDLSPQQLEGAVYNAMSKQARKQ